MNYELLDSGNEQKLERFGDVVLSRPASGAVWEPGLDQSVWQGADAIFSREKGTRWKTKDSVPNSWEIALQGIKLKISLTEFGHTGAFPEHSQFWPWIQKLISSAGREIKLLNLFAYSGGATLAAAKVGAKVCHLDSSKGMVSWAGENARLNGLKDAPIRWIVDDAMNFLKREEKRKSYYDAIILDPPSFGRGSKGQVFKIERDLPQLLSICKGLLTQKPLFILLTCHTPGFTPTTLHHLLHQTMENGQIEVGEVLLKGKQQFSIPSGSYAKWIS